MPNRFRSRPVPAIVAAGTALLLAGCGSGGTPAQYSGGTDAGRIAVVTSTNVYGSIAEAVGGDRVTVTSLISDPAADPHSFESTPADAAKVAQAKVVVFNGGGYDDFMPKLVEAAGRSDRTVVDVATLSGLEPAVGEEFNEHVWYNLPAVEKLVNELAIDLGKADPANAAAFRSSATAYLARIEELQARIDTIAAGHRGDRVAITEPVPGYLVEAAGLTNATPPEFAEAVEEDTDPPAAVLQQTLALFAGTPVRVLVLNAQTQTPTTDQVKQAAQTAGVPVVDVTETLPEGQTDYVTWMGGQIDALAAALDR